MAGIKKDRYSITLVFVLMAIVGVALVLYLSGMFRGEQVVQQPATPPELIQDPRLPPPGADPPAEGDGTISSVR